MTTAAGAASSGDGAGTTLVVLPVPVVPAPMQVLSAPSTDVGPVTAGYAATGTDGAATTARAVLSPACGGR